MNQLCLFHNGYYKRRITIQVFSFLLIMRMCAFSMLVIDALSVHRSSAIGIFSIVVYCPLSEKSRSLAVGNFRSPLIVGNTTFTLFFLRRNTMFTHTKCPRRRQRAGPCIQCDFIPVLEPSGRFHIVFFFPILFCIFTHLHFYKKIV